MIPRFTIYLFFAILFMASFSVSGYRYDDYSEGRFFFSDGQEWIFRRLDSNNVESPYRIKARVVGDTTISSYMDYYGEVVRVDQPCKIIRVISDAPDVPERRFAAYEWDAEIYVYSEEARDFVQMLIFNKSENVKFLNSGEKWNTDRVDYVSPHGRLLKRYSCSGVGIDKASKWIYRVGADCLWLNSSKWVDSGSLRLVSYYDPKDNVTYYPEDFEVESFTPDNKFYNDGKEWIYHSGYYEQRGNSDVFVHMVVDGDEEIEHMQCKRISYFLEGSEVGHTTTACSADGIMYERGYMNILTPRFNFNVVPGDIININDPASEVIGVDYVEVLNNHYKRIIFKGESSDSEWKYWVEGIGGNGTNDGLPYEEMENLSDIYIPGTFVKCIENGEVIFEQNDFCMGRSSIDSLPADYESNFEERIKIYTLEGVQTKNLAPGRIIVRQGNKYLLK